MVFFVIQVLILIQEASLTERQWEELDALAKMPNSRISRVRSISQSMHQNFQKKDTIFALCFPQLRNRKIEKAQMYITFKALREEFLLERSLDDPFHPAPEDKRVEADFNFGRYLSLAQAYTLTRIVEVEEKTWFFFGILIVGFYGICILVGRNIEVCRKDFVLKSTCSINNTNAAKQLPFGWATGDFLDLCRRWMVCLSRKYSFRTTHGGHSKSVYSQKISELGVFRTHVQRGTLIGR